MATNYSKLSGGSVKITRANGKASYKRFTNATVEYNDSVIIVDGGNGKYLEVNYADIGTINGSAKPGTIEATAELMADQVFNYGGGTGSGGTTSGVAQSYVDAKVSDLQSKIDANTGNISTNTGGLAAVVAALASYKIEVAATYKRIDHFIDVAKTLDFPSVAAQSVSAGITISDTDTAGISSANRILMGLSSNITKSLIIYGVAGTNLVTFYAINPTLAAIDNLAGTYRFTAYATG